MSDVTDPDLSKRALDLIELGAKFAIGLGSMKVFLSGVWKPFQEWRKEHQALTIRTVLAPELKQLREIINDESGCADNMKAALATMQQIFREIDAVLIVAADNRDRINETNDLLDELFHIDRRIDFERAAEIDTLLAQLAERQKLRRRMPPTAHPLAPLHDALLDQLDKKESA